jgi:N utilization substance protein B
MRVKYLKGIKMTRSELREQVFKMLFGAEFHEADEMPEQMRVYEEVEASWNEREKTYICGKCQDIIAHMDEIDEMINGAAEGWKTTRMGKVDLTLLRLAVYEMKFDPDIPVGVSINEAVELAKRYGTDDSSSFVNGVLGKLA